MAQITIIGLDTFGISLGLALRQTAQPPTIVGVDRDGAEARRAQQLGAVERTEVWVANACKNAALVILNEPFSRLRDMLAAIAESLPQGCVVTSTAALMVPVLAWADELLPQGVSFIAGHTILNPLKPVTEPSAGIFKQAQYCLSLQPQRTCRRWTWCRAWRRPSEHSPSSSMPPSTTGW